MNHEFGDTKEVAIYREEDGEWDEELGYYQRIVYIGPNLQGGEEDCSCLWCREDEFNEDDFDWKGADAFQDVTFCALDDAATGAWLCEPHLEMFMSESGLTRQQAIFGKE